jgi:hypothetical protein
MSSFSIRSTCAMAVLGALAAAAPIAAQAESASDDWAFTATIYGWLPTMGGDLSIPIVGNTNARLDPGDVLDALNFTFMGMGDVRKGRWGAATDIIYLDLGGEKKGLRDLTIGEQELPAQLTATANLDLKGWVWTLGGTYLVVDEPEHPMSVLAGTRMLDLSTDLKLKFEGDIVGTPLPGRTVKGDASLTNWDAIVGVKGRFRFGEDGDWFVPYYVDIGTGQSDLTWQAILGVGYSFGWGDLTAAWRYLDYDFGSDNAVETLWQSGAAIGATFHF